MYRGVLARTRGVREAGLEARPLAGQAHPHQPKPDSDEALVARVLEGEGVAFDALYDRYFPRIYAHLAVQRSDQGELERGVEEVLRRVFSSLEDFRLQGQGQGQDAHVSFAAWVLGVARVVQREAGGS